MTAHSRLPQPLVESIRKALTLQRASRRDRRPVARRRARDRRISRRDRRPPPPRRACAGHRIDGRRGGQTPDADRDGQRRHAVPRGFGRQRDRGPATDDPSAAASRGLCRSRRQWGAEGSSRLCVPTRSDGNRWSISSSIAPMPAVARNSPRICGACSRTCASRSGTGMRCRTRCAQTRLRIPDPEGQALLDWFAQRAMTCSDTMSRSPTSSPSETLGIFSVPGAPTDEGGFRRHAVPRAGRRRAADTKAERLDRPPPGAARPGRRSAERGWKGPGIGVHAGMWTSGARLPPEDVPVLRRRLDPARRGFRVRPQGAFRKGAAPRGRLAPARLLLAVEL